MRLTSRGCVPCAVAMLAVAAAVPVSGIPRAGAVAAAVPVSGMPRAGAVRNGPPTHLTVGSRTQPIGIDDSRPDLAWQVSDLRRGAVQAAYQVLVATAPTTTPGRPGVIWDSGVVPSPQQAFVAYGGPTLASDTAYYWTVRTWDASGESSPFAVPQRFETGLHDADWHASWIRETPDPSPPAGEQYAYVRKTTALASSPVVRARAYVSAASQFELWINGRRLDRGESFAFPDSQYYQTTDVTGALRPGAVNAFGLLYHWYGSGKGRPGAPPGAIAQISVDHADGTRELIVTDGTWRTAPAQWKEPAPLRNNEGENDRVENVDGRAFPRGWDSPTFDDRSWTPVFVVGPHPTAPWTHLRSQSTRIVETRVAPASLRRLPSGSYVADFGKVYAARPSVTFRSGRSGEEIDMRAGYALDPDGLVSATHATQDTDMGYSYVERSGAQRFTSFGYLGFRYLEIDDPGGHLTPRDVVALARHSAMPDGGAATFSSSNSTVDAEFQLARHSALYTSQEQFIDTPTREQGPFLRDGFNESWTAMRAFGERNLTQQALTDFAQSQARFWPDGRVNAIYPTDQGARDIPDFTEIFPEWVWMYYTDTGDAAMLARMYPVMQSIAAYVDRYTDPATGLIANLAGGGTDYAGGLVDWPPAMRYGYDMSTAARTTVNMLAVDVFRRTAQAAAALHRPAAEEALDRARADWLTAAIDQRLERADGVFVDGLEAGHVPSTHASQIANAYALAYGVTPARFRGRVAAYVAGPRIQMGPQTAESLLRALNETGHDSDLVRLLTDPVGPGWANILSRGATFTWETWSPIDAEGDSESHGWGSTVLVDIQQDLLGVSPLAPGFESIEVRPPSGALEWARGTVPTEHGPVRVDWSRPTTSGEPFRLSVSVPANSRATVYLPTRGSDLTESGRPLGDSPGVRLVGVHDGIAQVSVGSGSYSFES